MTKYFRVAPMAAVAFAITLMFVGALAYFAVLTALALYGGKEPDTFTLLAGILLVVVIGFAWLRSVRGYRLAQDEVIVDRAGPGKVHIAIENITSVEVKPNLGSFMRTNMLSTQGLFGWAGAAEVRKPTDVKSLHAEVYGTNPANTVVLQLANGNTIILTPRDTEGFADALRGAGIGGPSPSLLPTPRGHYKQGPRKKRRQ